MVWYGVTCEMIHTSGPMQGSVAVTGAGVPVPTTKRGREVVS